MSTAKTAVFLVLCLSYLTASAKGQDPGSEVAPPGVRQDSPGLEKLPTEVILVPGAVASASDSTTPLPESGRTINNVYASQYFGLSYPLFAGFAQKHTGPPPSDTGYYLLAFIARSKTPGGPTPASILVTAQDLFFSLTPGRNAAELIRYTKDNLQPYYKVERQPVDVKIATRSFTRFDYMSPAADLHWSVLATQIRCHIVQFVLTSRDPQLLENLIQDMDKMKLPAEAGPTSGTGGGDSPVCMKGYATRQNVIEKVDPVFSEQRFNPIPVRIIIDKAGRVKHAHFISAFPEQAKAIEEALMRWRFKPYLLDGQPVEVETGVMFGNSVRNRPSTGTAKPAINVTN
jgi:hypothetical protein